MSIDVSIVLATRDGMATLPRVIAALRAQQTARRYEIVAIDSGSTDGTRALLQREADVLIDIDAADFDHGRSRNAAVARTSGALVILLVQDAIPIGPHWLDSLVAPLDADPGVAGAFARQRARPDASGVARASLAGWIASWPAPRTVWLTGASQLDAMTPAERLHHCAYDNVCSCLRRSVWERVPFRATAIGEDVAWAREVLVAGYGISYAPGAVVEHSHDKSLAYEFRRTHLLHAHLRDQFGLHAIPTIPMLLRAVAMTTRAHLAWETDWRWRPRAIGLAMVWPLAQYLGARRARRTGSAACAS